jgi:hypothetical protein
VRRPDVRFEQVSDLVPVAPEISAPVELPRSLTRDGLAGCASQVAEETADILSCDVLVPGCRPDLPVVG